MHRSFFFLVDEVVLPGKYRGCASYLSFKQLSVCTVQAGRQSVNFSSSVCLQILFLKRSRRRANSSAIGHSTDRIEMTTLVFELQIKLRRLEQSNAFILALGCCSSCRHYF